MTAADRHRFAGPPSWWPENEPWPPMGRRHGWRRGRARFVRRLAFMFGLMLLLTATGAVSLVSFLASRFGFVSGRHPPPSAPVAAVAIALILIVALVFAMRRVGWPLGDVVAASKRVADGDYGVRVAEQGPPSLRSVARAFNSMTARLQLQDEQRRHLMADIAHELRTPLTVVQGRLEGLLDGVYPRDDARLNEVLEDTRVLARLVEDLRTLANAESGALGLRREPTDLGVLVHDTVTTFAMDAAAKKVTIRVDSHAELPPVDVDPVRIREVLRNLLANALHHSPPDSVISVSVEQQPTHIAVSVRDSGSGITPEALPHIFNRFFKGPSSSGSGLGLTIARNLVVAHGGEIHAESRAGEGTTMTFTLPIQWGAADGRA
jgi:signal transduction histidine kinase